MLKTKRWRRSLSTGLIGMASAALILSASPFGFSAADTDGPTLAQSAIQAAEFAEPGIEYRPGVRWWWPGNGATKEDLLAQVEYLHDNGFGAVEIVAFSKGFLTGNGTTTGYVYDGAHLGYDVEQILGYESPEYFDKLEAVVARANELGITVDLNIGSGYLANDDSISVSDSQGNMALGRATVTFDADSGFTLVSGDINVPAGTGSVDLGIPEVEVSPFYASELFGFDFGVWSDADVRRSAVILAPVLDSGEALTTNNQVLDRDFSSVKTYDNQTVVDLANAHVLYPDSAADVFTIDTTAIVPGDYEVIALYSVPAGNFGLNSIIENTTTQKRNFVVDHLNPSSVAAMINGWLGEPRLNEIVESHDVRAAFNDSYEFYTDSQYNSLLQAAASSEELLGYDITRFIPSFYSFFEDSFLIDGAPTVKEEFSALGLEDLTLGRFSGDGPRLLATELSADEIARVEYDYGVLLNASYQAGMQAFSETLGEYGIAYRQQAYNPPVDTLKSSAFVDIPETEGLDEYSLKRVSSGAHLYGKNLVTSEVYTLGSVPFTVTPQFIKQGYDLMATSGVNNFFYHGLSATYFGNPDDPADDDLFVEEGWRAWPTIGVEMAETAAISDYYASMNAYAARANYTMQAGAPSADVAVYMPLFGALASGGGFGGGSTPLSSVTLLQENGYIWDAINDDTIQHGLVWEGGKLIANGGNMAFDALVVESDTVPVETMEALRDLRASGAPVYFLDEAPIRQPGYADGDFAALDAEVAAIAGETGGVVTAEALVGSLAELDAAPITYDANTNLRFNRRELPTGGELAYLRNTSVTSPTTVSIQVASQLPNCYWLDQETGAIHKAQLIDGGVSVTLQANGAVILLCEPAGVGFSSTDLTHGVPAVIDDTELPFTIGLDDFSLSVTSDNIGSNEPGESKTVSYDGDVLGDWTSSEVVNGDLTYVTDPGTYRTVFQVGDANSLDGEQVVLQLGHVRDAATVTVNPGTPSELSVQLYHAPFQVDITSALVVGENEVLIEVQPVKNNRRVGLQRLYASDPVANVRYQGYRSLHGNTSLMSAGLLGPVSIAASLDFTEVSVPPVPEPTPTTTVTVTAKPAPGRDLYETPGFHKSSGRNWMTVCETYSSKVDRCWTYIWATTVHEAGGVFTQINGWQFNNLTYIGGARADWASNPLGHTGRWTAEDGRQWRTECDTANTGRGGCRSYITASVIERDGDTYRWVTKEVFNNQVRFG